MQPYALLIATHDDATREYLAGQFDADGHTAYRADSITSATTTLALQVIDIVVLGELDSAADAAGWLRTLRAGRLDTHIHPAQPVVTIGDTDEIATVRAYEAGSDHHLARDSSYLVVRAATCAVARRCLETVTTRHLHIGDLHIDTAARSVEIHGRAVQLSRKEFDLLCQLASDPTRVFTKAQLMRSVWGTSAPLRTRTLDSHACRLRRKLAIQGGEGYVANRSGYGYTLLG